MLVVVVVVVVVASERWGTNRRRAVLTVRTGEVRDDCIIVTAVDSINNNSIGTVTNFFRATSPIFQDHLFYDTNPTVDTHLVAALFMLMYRWSGRGCRCRR
jgi:hypothetical protein